MTLTMTLLQRVRLCSPFAALFALSLTGCGSSATTPAEPPDSTSTSGAETAPAAPATGTAPACDGIPFDAAEEAIWKRVLEAAGNPKSQGSVEQIVREETRSALQERAVSADCERVTQASLDELLALADKGGRETKEYVAVPGKGGELDQGVFEFLDAKRLCPIFPWCKKAK